LHALRFGTQSKTVKQAALLAWYESLFLVYSYPILIINHIVMSHQLKH